MNAVAFLAALVLALVATATAAAAKAPFPVPATYKAGTMHSLTFAADGKLTVASSVRCFRAPCPEAGGKGTWSYDAKADAITIRMEVTPTWSVAQTWTCPGKSRDMNVSHMGGCKIVSFAGTQADKLPVPADANSWNRQ
ncbi:hypothetical protein H9P43_007721 [Blastocladiella emersonii ATCC 22665]|nr:hypothetical protein H9P43_007716 [Blastocladiella emersonii ATCC 22665]KAI9168349.1 hypothetical protein H9P43_007721 [Blastocladiella emersonii ATCC 22665]